MFLCLYRDRFRTTNNMLGDCYAAAIVEKLSKKELMACDVILSNDTSNFDKNIVQNTDLNDIIVQGCANGAPKSE